MSESYLPDVIDQIRAEIPDDFEKKRELEVELDRVRRSALYSAPEIMTTRWNQAAEVLNRLLPAPPAAPWQERIRQIFAGELLGSAALERDGA